MSDLTMRAARPDELDLVRSTYAAWGYGGGAEPDDVVLMAERDGELLGLVRHTVEHGVLMLRGMQVAPSARGEGIGARLLAEFVGRIDGRECYCVPYSHLIGFYGSQGFELTAPESAPEFLAARLATYRANGLDVVLMRRPPSTNAPPAPDAPSPRTTPG